MNKLARILTIVSIVAFLIGGLLFGQGINEVQPDNQVQFKTDVYHHFTVYTDRLDGQLFVIEIDVDNTTPYACDGWLENEDNGHNCVIVSADGIHEILADYKLLITYPNVKGE